MPVISRSAIMDSGVLSEVATVDTENSVSKAGEIRAKGPAKPSMLILLRWIQAGALLAGIALLVFFAAAVVDRLLGRDRQLAASAAAGGAGLDMARARPPTRVSGPRPGSRSIGKA